MPLPRFEKQVIATIENDIPPSPFNTLSAAGDITGNGRIDLVISGRNGRMVWLENTGRPGLWPVHLVDEPGRMECGGSLYDLTGSGGADIINGGDWRSDELSWWQNPGPVVLATGSRWVRRVIAKTGQAQFHDTLFGDVTNQGRPSLVFTNQSGGTTIYCLPLPEDPTLSPWPGLEVIAARRGEPNPRNRYLADGIQPEEGLAMGDIDGDGLNELVCGTHWYKWVNGEWQSHRFTHEYLTTKIAIGDVDGDGCNEIVLAEGDRCIYGWGEVGGRLAWFKPGQKVTDLWEEHLVSEGLLDAHSLQLADLCGSGRLDIFTAEIGMGDPETGQYRHRQPRLLIFENLGAGRFQEYVIDEGTGTHDARLLDLTGSGRLDIFGKPLHGPEMWNVHVWWNRGS